MNNATSSERSQLIGLASAGQLTAGEASEKLNLSIRQIRRLIGRFRKFGTSGFFASPRRNPWNRTDKGIVERILSLKREGPWQKQKPQDEYETTIQRIILDLGSVMVNHKPYEPQGKGRIERFFWFMQDRFIKEHTAKNLDELNRQFKVWIKWYNTKHVIRTINLVPKDRFNPEGFKPVPEDTNFEKVFSYHYTRKVNKYNSFSLFGYDYVIDPKNCKEWNGCLAACEVELYVTPETITVYHYDKRIQQFKNRSGKTK